MRSIVFHLELDLPPQLAPLDLFSLREEKALFLISAIMRKVLPRESKLCSKLNFFDSRACEVRVFAQPAIENTRSLALKLYKMRQAAFVPTYH